MPVEPILLGPRARRCKVAIVRSEERGDEIRDGGGSGWRKVMRWENTDGEEGKKCQWGTGIGENIFVSRQMRDYGAYVVLARNLLFVKCYLDRYRVTRKCMRSLRLITVRDFSEGYDLFSAGKIKM